LRVIRCPTLQVSQFLFPGQRSDTFLTDHVHCIEWHSLSKWVFQHRVQDIIWLALHSVWMCILQFQNYTYSFPNIGPSTAHGGTNQLPKSCSVHYKKKSFHSKSTV